MTSRANYTAEEWEGLSLAPIQAGMTVLFAAKSGVIGTAQEAMALYNATNRKAAKQYPNNQLIQSLLTEDRSNMDKLTVQKVGAYMTDTNARQRIKPELMQLCHNISTFLSQKAAPNEAQEYKKWLMDVSLQVANAGAEGGQRISPEEQATMNEIATALNIQPGGAAGPTY